MTTPQRRRSLRREILIWYSGVLLIAMGAATGLTFLLLRQALERSTRTSLEQAAQAVEGLYVPESMPRLETHEQIVRLRQHVQAIRRQTVLATGDTATTYLALVDDSDQNALRSFLLISALLIPLTAAAAAAGGRMLLDRLLTPLDRLVEATREIGIAGLSRRVHEPERPAELQDLAHAFNEMLTRLDRAVQALSRFTADASHELRTPLTSIRGSIQVTLARDRSPAELEDTLADVLEETEWMLHLVDGLLTLARGEEGNVLPDARTVDLEPLLTDVFEVGQALAAGKPISLKLDVDGPLSVNGSAGQLRQVMLNLISNAVKFTDAGEVTISARSIPDDEQAPVSSAGPARSEPGRWVEVRVADTGTGIAPEELPRVFDRFYRGESARGRPGGAGLGLAIARLIVEQHGGRIEVQSEFGRGSEFRILLPETATPAPTSTAALMQPAGLE